MWEYKVVRLTGGELQTVNNNVDRIRQGVNAEFKQKHPDWETKKQDLSEEDQEAFLEKEFYGPIRQRIKAIHPGIPLEDKRPDSWSFTPVQYLEWKLNEFAHEGWELDRMRLLKPDSYDDGILILRRKLIEE
ncbi:MAG: hypothetical protein ACXACI_02865 [Candidatus Hodarchaeales archaeon]|jgi:hypothetical protein